MYNLGPDGHPEPGGPLPNFYSHPVPRVCSLCFFLLRTLPELIAAERERLHAEREAAHPAD